MFSEPRTPGTLMEDSFSEVKPPLFDVDVGPSGTSGTSAIQAKLNRRLGPEYVSQRPAPGGGPKLTYVEGWKIIGLANEVFGYNGWCSTVTKMETDFIDMDPESRRYNIGVTALVKITLKDGTYHEDIGYGTGENLRSKGAALDKAKKEAVTDGVKRALRNFGNLLGLCLYEKSFTQEVVKIKPQHPKFDENDLHRREQQSASTSAVPTASRAHDVSSVSFSGPLEDMKPILATTTPMRSAIAKPSPLRNAILGERAHKSMDEDRRRPASDVLTRTLTTVERPAQSKYQTTSGNRAAPPDMARAVHADRALPPRLQSPPRGSSSEQKAASISLHRRLDTNVASPPPLKVSDSDPDMYFNDEDNDAFLAIEDSVMQGVEPAGMVDDVQDRAYDANRNATRNESSRVTGGTRPQVATTMVTTNSNRISALPSDQPMSDLRRAIRASTASLAAAGVKRPAEVIHSQYPQSIGVSPAQQQQRLGASSGTREPFRDLPIDGGTDVKRIKR